MISIEKTWTIKEIKEKRDYIFLEWIDSNLWTATNRMGYIIIRNGNGRRLGSTKRISYTTYKKLEKKEND